MKDKVVELLKATGYELINTNQYQIPDRPDVVFQVGYGCRQWTVTRKDNPQTPFVTHTYWKLPDSQFASVPPSLVEAMLP